MKLIDRNLALAIASLGLIGVFGCGESNETMVTKETSGEKAGVAPANAPKTYEEVLKYQKSIPSATAGGTKGYGTSQTRGRR